MIPEFPRFAPVTADMIAELRQLGEHRVPSSDFTPMSLWCWGESPEYRVSRLNDTLVVDFAPYVGHDRFLSFFGEDDVASSLSQIHAHAVAQGYRERPVQLIPESTAARLRDLPDPPELIEDRDAADYVFDVEDARRRLGSQYRNLRRDLNKFDREHADAVLIDDVAAEWFTTNQEGVLGLCERWLTTVDDPAAITSARRELRAIERFCDAAESVSRHAALDTYSLRYDGDLAGFAVWERCGDEAVALFMKADLRIAGLSTHFWFACVDRLAELGVRTLNLSQDLGIEGLRRHKSLLRPTLLRRKYALTP